MVAAEASTTGAYSFPACGAHFPGAPLFLSNVDFQIVSTGPLPFVPPIRRIPSGAETTAAPARGSGSFRSSLAASAGCQLPSEPVVESGERTKTVSVGLPSAPYPPIT